MATSKRITVDLTEKQYEALAGAIAGADLEEESEDLDRAQKARARSRRDAWNKIRNAWYGRTS